MTNGRSQSHPTVPRASHAGGSHALALALRNALPPLAGVAAAAALWLTLEKPAAAQQVFGSRGQLAVTAEEVFDFSTQTLHIDVPGSNQQYSNTSTRFGFLFSGRSGDVISINGPKFGVHYFVIPNLSIGGTVGYESRGGSTSYPEGANSFRTFDKRSESSFVLLPKVGYALMFTQMMGFWFRGGIGYAHTSVRDVFGVDHASLDHWLLNFDAPFLLSPAPNLAFYIGPKLDFSFTGSADLITALGQTTSTGSSYFNFSVNAGLIGHFYVW